jgi:hypothetical protein
MALAANVLIAHKIIDVLRGRVNRPELIKVPGMTQLRHHLYTEEGRAYCVAACGPEEKPAGPPTCALCVPDRGMIQLGASGDGHFASWHCKGCGETFATHDHGVTWKKTKEDA